MPNRTATIILVLTALALTPVVLHAGFNIEVWPLNRLSPAPVFDSGLREARPMI
jgi:hypothetical protein